MHNSAILFCSALLVALVLAQFDSWFAEHGMTRTRGKPYYQVSSNNP